jgi:hypothetical protein
MRRTSGPDSHQSVLTPADSDEEPFLTFASQGEHALDGGAGDTFTKK